MRIGPPSGDLSAPGIVQEDVGTVARATCPDFRGPFAWEAYPAVAAGIVALGRHPWYIRSRRDAAAIQERRRKEGRRG